MARHNPGEILFTTAGPNIRPNPPRAVSITWDAGGEEFRVRVVGNSREDYFTNDYDDAVATAKVMAQGGEVSDKTPKSKRPKSNPRKSATKRTNSAKSVADPVGARELELYIENEYALVGAANSIGKAVMKNLAQKMARGTYDATKAWKGWMYLVDEGAKRYNREFGTKFGTGAFNKATREMVAVRLAEVFESEVKSGTINVSELIGKANPARRKNARETGPFKTMAQIKEANAARGDHFFDRDTMKFFASKVEGGPYGGRYFVTSEKTGFTSTKRAYTVRRASDDGQIRTVGKMGEFMFKEDAVAHARKLAAQA